ncbi:MAG: TonB family protein, partial [Myxococcota bacterium]|nr:TonB family protein [Myxococcota bacterium]
MNNSNDHTPTRLARRRLESSWRALLIACATLGFSGFARAEPEGGDGTATSEPALVAPELVENAEPVYPESRRASGETAKVVLSLTLDEAGAITSASVLESGGEDFDAAALQAAKRLVFEPAQKGGKAVPARIAFRFDFELKEAAPRPAEPAPQPVAAPLAPKAAQPAPEAPPSVDIDVEGERPPREATKRVISAEEITKIPGTNGDALRAVTNLPGVA